MMHIGQVVDFVELIRPEVIEVPKHWYALLVEPQREVTAAAGLVGRGIKTYAPTYRKRVPCPRRKHGQRVVDRALFPGYVFVKVPENQRWGRILSVPGVAEVYSTIDSAGRSVYRQMSIDEMAIIEEIEIGLDGKFKARNGGWELGQLVEIVGGPLAMLGYVLTGTVQRVDKSGQIRVSIPQFGGASAVTLSAAEIRAA